MTTVHICPDCAHVQSHGGRCRNRQAHELDERVWMEPVAFVPAEDAEALARAVSASLTHGEQSPLATALSVYLEKHPWSDL